MPSKFGDFVARHKVAVAAGGAILAALILCLIVAAAVGAFSGPPWFVQSFTVLSIEDSAGAADVDDGALVDATFYRIRHVEYAGPVQDGEVFLGAWASQDGSYFFTYSRVLGSNLHVKRLTSKTAVLFATDPVGDAVRVPVDNAGAWARVYAADTSTNALGPRTVLFATPAKASALRLARAVHTAAAGAARTLATAVGKTHLALLGRSHMAKGRGRGQGPGRGQGQGRGRGIITLRPTPPMPSAWEPSPA